MALGDYLAGEVVQDFADGLLSRREALRRLGLLGLTMTGAGALLAACGGDDDNGGAATATTTAAPAPSGTGPSGRRAEAVTFPGPSGELQGAYASPADPKASVLVIHENRGLTPHFYDVVGRLASEGYAALAVDLLSAQGGTSRLADPAAAPAALSAAPLDSLLADLRAGIDELERRHPGHKAGVVGFCFGGGMVWNLLNTGEGRLDAAAPFLRPGAGERRLQPSQGGRSRCLRRERCPGQRHPRPGRGGAQVSRAALRDPHLPRRRPRLLQRDRAALQRPSRPGGLRRSRGLVQPAPGVGPLSARRRAGAPPRPSPTR